MRWRRDRARGRYRQRLPREERAGSGRRSSRRCYRQPRRHRSWRRSGASRAPAPTPSGARDVRRPELIQARDRPQADAAAARRPSRQLGMAAARRRRAIFRFRSTSSISRSASPSLDAFLRDVRCRFGGKLIPRKEFVYEPSLSHAGEPRAYALIADQTPRKERIPSTGRASCGRTRHSSSALTRSPSSSSRRCTSCRCGASGAAITRCASTCSAEPPYENFDDALIVERYARCLEAAIVESPADWLWLQKKMEIR